MTDAEQNTFALDWVKDELDASLKQAAQSLEFFVEDPRDDIELHSCRETLQQVVGTLRMVAIDGALRFADEMLHLVHGLVDGSVARSDTVYEALMRGLLQLPAYLEYLKAGNADLPEVLLPDLNEMRQLTGRAPLDGSAFLAVDLAALPPPPGADQELRPLREVAAKSRPIYQSGLLSWLQRPGDPARSRLLLRICERLRQSATHPALQRLWWAAGGLFEVLSEGALAIDGDVKRLLTRLDLQLKQAARAGEDELDEEDLAGLTRALLYRVGKAPPHTVLAAALGEAFGLCVPADDEIEAVARGLHGPDAAVLRSVAEGVKEDYNRAKDIIEIFGASSNATAADLEPLVEQLGRIAETLGMMGLGAVSMAVREQRDRVRSMLAGDLEAHESTAVDIAEVLLHAESFLTEMIGGTGRALHAADMLAELPTATRSKHGVALPCMTALEQRQMARALFKVTLAEVGAVRETLAALAGGVADPAALAGLPSRLLAAAGALYVLDRPRPSDLAGQLAGVVEQALVEGIERLPEGQFEQLAEIITALESALEAFASDQHGEAYLAAAEARIARLLTYAAASQSEPLPEAPAVELSAERPAAPVDVEAWGEAPGQAADAQDAAGEAAGIDAVEVFADEPEVPVLSADFDPETLEIFLEEADEVVGTLREQVPAWRADPGDAARLGEIRRAFHTLKGSGRLVGALRVGEYAWAHESLLNRVLDGACAATPELGGLVAEGVALLPALIEELRGGVSPGAAVVLQMRRAEALAGGEPLPEAPAVELPAAPAEAPAEAASEALPAPRIDPQLLEIYAREVHGHLRNLTQYVADARAFGVPANPSDERLTRALHTLRGSSSMAEAASIARLAEALEARCNRLRAAHQGMDASELALIDATAQGVVAALGALADAACPLPANDDLLQRIDAPLPAAAATSAESPAAALDEGAVPGDDMLLAGADLLDMLDDAVSRWVAASADTGPLVELGSRAATLAEVARSDGFAAIAGLVEALGGLVAVLASGGLGAEPAVLATLDEAADALTDMFDQVAVLKPATSADALVRRLAELASTPAVRPAPARRPAVVEAAWSPDEASDPDLLSLFIDEGSELLDEAEATVHRWRGDTGDHAAIALLQRQLHTLKGGARMAGITPMGDLSHAAESLLTGVVEGRIAASDSLFEVLNGAVDRLVGMLDAVRAQQPMAPASDLLEELGDFIAGTARPTPVSEPPGDARWTPSDEPDAALLEVFLDESGELLDAAEATVHRWHEQVDDRAAIALLQRQLHTLKGGARMAGITPMGDLSHAAESLLTGVVEGRLEPSESLFRTLNLAVDRLAEMHAAVHSRRPLNWARDLQAALTALGEGRTPAALTDTPETIPPPPQIEKVWDQAHPANEQETATAPVRRGGVLHQEQVRVHAELLNRLVNLAGEVSIYRSRLEQQNSVFRYNLVELEQTVLRLRDQLRKLEIETDAQIMFRLEEQGRTVDDFDPLEMDRYSTLQTLSRALLESLDDLTNIRELLADLSRETETLLVQQSRVNSELQQGLMQARMMPFSRIVPRMRRIVRQTSAEMGKRVDLWVQGEQSEVDSAVIDRIVAPLEHLIRNAIAHGIETPAVRTAHGKPETGKITLTVDRDGSDIVFRVKDDGAGIDVEKVRAKAIEKGLLAATAEVSEHDLLQFIFESGMTTANQVTQISGRGVGMDVVISETKQLGGNVEINSRPGLGASFYIRLPFTLAVNRALLATVGEDLFAIPLTSIEGIVRMRGDELKAFYEGRRSDFTHAGKAYLIRHLGRLLGVGAPDLAQPEERIPVLLVRSGEQGIALQVDSLAGSREIVVKSVGPQLSTVRGLFGATILVDGRVALILDTAALVRMGATQQAAAARGVEAVAAPADAGGKLKVMIVDDSITVRRVTSRLLERHGFEVVTAKDGVDALNQLHEMLPDIMLLDIEMPRMDGFELATHVRGDAQFAQLPIIMITSRTGDKHRQRGTAIGVNRFLGKPYQDAELLETIRELTASREVVHG